MRQQVKEMEKCKSYFKRPDLAQVLCDGKIQAMQQEIQRALDEFDAALMRYDKTLKQLQDSQDPQEQQKLVQQLQQWQGTMESIVETLPKEASIDITTIGGKVSVPIFLPSTVGELRQKLSAQLGGVDPAFIRLSYRGQPAPDDMIITAGHIGEGWYFMVYTN